MNLTEHQANEIQNLQRFRYIFPFILTFYHCLKLITTCSEMAPFLTKETSLLLFKSLLLTATWTGQVLTITLMLFLSKFEPLIVVITFVARQCNGQMSSSSSLTTHSIFSNTNRNQFINAPLITQSSIWDFQLLILDQQGVKKWTTKSSIMGIFTSLNLVALSTIFKTCFLVLLYQVLEKLFRRFVISILSKSLNFYLIVSRILAVSELGTPP